MKREGLLAKDAPAGWIDSDGTIRKTPKWRGTHRLRFAYPLHAALGRFVFQRDRLQCQICGARPDKTAIEAYLAGGKEPSITGLDGRKHWLVLDHVISARNGGAHHPENLQVLCDTCNAVKSSKTDSLGPPRSAR